MTSEPILRRAGREDTADICALLTATFPGAAKADPRVLTWQYWDNPFGETASWVAEREGEVVAHYAAYCLPGRLGVERVTLAMGADAATSPAARGLGLFTRLATAVWDDVAERNGVRLVLTAPNPNSKGGAKRGGMTPVADLPAHVRPLDRSWLAARFRLPRALAAAAVAGAFRPRRLKGGITARRVDDIPEDLDVLCDAIRPPVTWGVDPSAAWWRWRFAGRPDHAYRYAEARRGGRLAGAAVATEEDAYGARFLLVLEVLGRDAEGAAAALDAVVTDAGDAVGAALVAFPGHPVARWARRAGFRRLPRRLEPRPLHFGAVVRDPALPDPALLPWNLQWSFLDHL